MPEISIPREATDSKRFGQRGFRFGEFVDLQSHVPELVPSDGRGLHVPAVDRGFDAGEKKRLGSLPVSGAGGVGSGMQIQMAPSEKDR